MAKFAIILPAAGKSTRFSAQKRKKPFVELKGRAVWLRSAELFVNRDDVVQTIVVVGKDDLEWFREKFRPNLAFMNVEIVEGGAERSDSVQNGLASVSDEADYVAIHDAARPLLVTEWIDTLFKAAEKHGAVIPAIPVASTLKRVKDQAITETVSREDLWQAQTPQVFRKDWLVDSFAKRGATNPTDEAQLVENAGHPVHVVTGSPMNFKITTRDDFKMAEAVLGALPKPSLTRSIHPFAEEEKRGLF